MQGEYFVYFISIAVFMVLSAFFSGTETAIVSASRPKMENYVKKGNKNAVRALGILSNMDQYISMILIGNNLVKIAAASFITFVVTRAYVLKQSHLFFVTLAQTLVFLIVCVVTPKIFSRAFAGRYVMFFSRIIVMFIIILKPAVMLTSYVTRFIKKMLHVTDDRSALVTSRDEIDIFFQIGETEGVIDEDHQSLISEVLSIRDISANEVMTPTIDILSVNKNTPVRDLVKLIVQTKYSRIPVYEERVDNITGYIFYRDLIFKPQVQSVSELMNLPIYIPATKNIYDLYIEMKEKNELMVFVVNEFGAVIGMVTHEDIAEEVVGEINTSDHEGDVLIEQVNKRKFSVAGETDIEYFIKKFNIPIEKKGFETVAGFLMYITGRIPRKGEKIQYNSYTFIVEESTNRSIEKVMLLLPK